MSCVGSAGPEGGSRILRVLGPHRSGTSLTGQLLARLGFDFGDHLIAAKADNPRGFYEDSDVLAVTKEIEKITDRHHARVSGALPMPEGWMDLPEVVGLKATLTEVVRRRLAECPGIWGVKDPRMLRMLPLWDEVIGAVGVPTRSLFVIRHPAATIASLAERNGLSLKTAELIWLRQIADFAGHQAMQADFFVDYDAIIEAPAATVAELRERLGTAFALSDADVETVVGDVVSPNLNRHDASRAEGLQPQTMRAYQALKAAAGGEDVRAEAQRLRDFVDTWDSIGKPWQDALVDAGEEVGKLRRTVRSIEKARAEHRKLLEENARLLREHTLQATRISDLSRRSDHLAERIGSLSEVLPARRFLVPMERRAADERREFSFANMPAFHADWPEVTTSRRICILTQDIFGPILNAGIGTAWMHAARFLAANGHDVTILYTQGENSQQGPISHWRSFYEDMGVTFLPTRDFGMESFEHPSRSARLSYNALLNLRELEPFEIIHSSECGASPFYPLMAKCFLGEFDRTVFCIKTSSPQRWSVEGHEQHWSGGERFHISFMEQRCVELADVIISPTQHMLRWMSSKGYDFAAERCIVHPNIQSDELPVRGDAVLDASPPEGFDEIVYFGRLEPRKGLHVFRGALEVLKARGALEGRRATFLGKRADVFDFDRFLAEVQHAVDAPIDAVTDANSQQAIAYLKRPGVLAVIPSLMDNSPFTVNECLIHGIPFVSTDVGGIPEMIAVPDLGNVIAPPTAYGLAARIGDQLEHPTRLARPRYDLAWAMEEWLAFHRRLSVDAVHRLAPRPKSLANLSGPRPTSSFEVIMRVTRVEIETGQAASTIDSLQRSTRRPGRIVIVTDGEVPARQLRAFLATAAERLPAPVVHLDNREPDRLSFLEIAAGGGIGEPVVVVLEQSCRLRPDAIALLLTPIEAAGAVIATSLFAQPRADRNGDGAATAGEIVLACGPVIDGALGMQPFQGGPLWAMRRDALEDVMRQCRGRDIYVDDRIVYLEVALQEFDRFALVPDCLYDIFERNAELNSIAEWQRKSGVRRVLEDHLPSFAYTYLDFVQGNWHLARRATKLEDRMRDILKATRILKSVRVTTDR